MNIRIDVKNLARWLAFLRDVPKSARSVALDAFSRYMLERLREYPSYKYVSRKNAYGYTFKSAKQRRWFWANGGPDMIGNNRTYRLQAGWKIEKGASYKIVNNVDYAGWVVGSSQARQPGAVGWKKAWDVITANAVGAIKAAQAAVMAKLNTK